MYPDYRIPAELRPAGPAAKADKRPIIWTIDLVRHWDLITIDLAERYGIDLHDPEVLARSWIGVRTLILGLLIVPSHLARTLGGEER